MGISRPALVIAAHGSRSEGWSEAVADFALDVAASPGVSDAFSLVQAAFLENALPRIPDAARMALSSGCPSVYVVPLFLTVSTHAGEDVPGLLGLPAPPHIRRRLVGEGHTPLVPGLPIRLVPLGDIESLLFKNVLRRTSLNCRDRSHEAVVLCAYGSTIYHAEWERLLHALRTRLMRDGFGYACHAYVGHIVGLSPAPTAQAITDAARMAGIRRVHVVPLLMSVSSLQQQTIAAAVRDVGRGKIQVIYEEDAILPDGDLAAHVGYRALEALGVFPTIGEGRHQA